MEKDTQKKDSSETKETEHETVKTEKHEEAGKPEVHTEKTTVEKKD